jgi:hypothetical protein
MKDYKGSLSKVTTVGSVDPLTGRPHRTAKPVRWKGDNAYFGMFHGFPGISGVERQFRPTASIDGTQTGRFLNRRPSVERLAPDGPIVLLSCSGGVAPGRGDLSGSPLVPHLGRSRGLRRFVADPLSPSARPVGQAVSTETRRTVFAAGAIVQIDIAGDGTIALMLLSTPAGDEADFHEYLPEPVGEEFDAVVAHTGLGGLPGLGPERARETALRLVHALRQTFGVHVQDDKDDPGGGYQRLLRGIGALEGMRQRDGNMRDTGEFTRSPPSPPTARRSFPSSPPHCTWRTPAASPSNSSPSKSCWTGSRRTTPCTSTRPVRRVPSWTPGSWPRRSRAGPTRAAPTTSKRGTPPTPPTHSWTVRRHRSRRFPNRAG